MKLGLKKLNKDSFGDISCKVQDAKVALDAIQQQLYAALSSELLEVEADSNKKYFELRVDKEVFYKQRSIINWVSLGD